MPDDTSNQEPKSVIIPAKVRFVIYILTGILTPVVVYAKLKGWIGDLELSLWGAEVTFVAGMAGLNTPSSSVK